MIMRLACLLSFLICFLALRSNGQVNVHIGATTAYNATFVLDKGLSGDPRYKPAFTYNWAPIGLNFGVDLSKGFGLSLEGIKSAQGQVYELIDIGKKVAGERKIELEYIHMPLLLRFMGTGTGGARANFNLGPQLSILTDARETIQAQGGEFEIPDGVDFESIKAEFPEATQTQEQASQGTYSLPEMSPQEILSKKNNDFRNTEFQIALAFGLDIDLSRHLYLTTQIRANYSLTDMRNGDVIDSIKNGNGSDVFGQRANLLVGIQLGIHYMFGTTRSFKFKR
jgi:hypothetical protein